MERSTCFPVHDAVLPIKPRKLGAALQLAAADLLGLYFLPYALMPIWNLHFHAERPPVTGERIVLTLCAILLVMGFFQWIVYYYRVHFSVRFHDNGIAFKKSFRKRFVAWDEITRCRVKNRRWADVRWPGGRLQLYWRG